MHPFSSRAASTARRRLTEPRDSSQDTSKEQQQVDPRVPSSQPKVAFAEFYSIGSLEIQSVWDGTARTSPEREHGKPAGHSPRQNIGGPISPMLAKRNNHNPNPNPNPNACRAEEPLTLTLNPNACQAEQPPCLAHTVPTCIERQTLSRIIHKTARGLTLRGVQNKLIVWSTLYTQPTQQ